MGKLIAGAAAISIIIPGFYLTISHLFIIVMIYKGKIDPWSGFIAIPVTVFVGGMMLLFGLKIGSELGVWKISKDNK